MRDPIPAMPGEDKEATEVVEARRLGYPYLVYGDDQGRQHVLSLSDEWDKITIGRGAGVDVILAWDADVSQIHAQLERLADSWIVVDDGLSANGTYVNGEAVERRRRLHDGDELRCGATTILFQAPFEARDATRVLPPL
ncbi:MAG: FHA domain-containing protein [Solirubrobacterales bacterium]